MTVGARSTGGGGEEFISISIIILSIDFLRVSSVLVESSMFIEVKLSFDLLRDDVVLTNRAVIFLVMIVGEDNDPGSFDTFDTGSIAFILLGIN